MMAKEASFTDALRHFLELLVSEDCTVQEKRYMSIQSSRSRRGRSIHGVLEF